jgi:hypothetical protein
MAGYVLGQAEAQDNFIGELLVALHIPKMPLINHLMLQQPLPVHSLHASTSAIGHLSIYVAK